MNFVPSGENATKFTSLICPYEVYKNCIFFTSQSLKELSSPPL